jgi:hypothetical protein
MQKILLSIEKALLSGIVCFVDMNSDRMAVMPKFLHNNLKDEWILSSNISMCSSHDFIRHFPATTITHPFCLSYTLV